MSARNTPRTKPVRMTRMHFQVIASVVANLDAEPGLTMLDHELLRTLAKRFANRLADTNDRFDRDTFIVACGFSP